MLANNSIFIVTSLEFESKREGGEAGGGGGGEEVLKVFYRDAPP